MSLDVYLKIDGAELDDVAAYESNITHNLSKMAFMAGLYEWLWEPEKVGAKTAKHLITPLTIGLATLEADREKFELFTHASGFGNYDSLVSFVRRYLAACKTYPEATVYAWQ